MTFLQSPPPVVIDASAALNRIEDAPKWIAAFARWAGDNRQLLAPTNLLAEIANGLMLGRQRLSAQAARERIQLVIESGIETTDRGLRGLFEAMTLAEMHGITVYDALYLQLAIDLDGELATEDRALRAAATAEGVTLVD